MFDGEKLGPEVKGYYLMKFDRWDLQIDNPILLLKRNIFTCYQEVHSAYALPLRRLDTDSLGWNRNDLADRPLHHHRICEIYQMYCH